MESLTLEEWSRLGDAIVIWTGWDSCAWPSRSDESLIKHVGAKAAAELLPIIRELETEFYKSDARHTASDLTVMEEIASAQFRAKYPALPEAAVRALAWCYSFDYK